MLLTLLSHPDTIERFLKVDEIVKELILIWCSRLLSTNSLKLNNCSTSVVVLCDLKHAFSSSKIVFLLRITCNTTLLGCSSGSHVLYYSSEDCVQSLGHCPVVQIFWQALTTPGPPCFWISAGMLLSTPGWWIRHTILQHSCCFSPLGPGPDHKFPKPSDFVYNFRALMTFSCWLAIKHSFFYDNRPSTSSSMRHHWGSNCPKYFTSNDSLNHTPDATCFGSPML